MILSTVGISVTPGDNSYIMGHLPTEDGGHLLGLATHIEGFGIVSHCLKVDLIGEVIIPFIPGSEGGKLPSLDKPFYGI